MSIKLQIAPHGTLRVGINLSNFLLVSGKDENNNPFGVSPEIARRVAQELNINYELIPFARPGELADAVNKDIWDIGNIAFEPERGKTIDFSDPYALIEANFLINKKIKYRNNSDLDRKDITIAVADRSAYDLWLTKNFKFAKLLKAKTINDSHDLFYKNKANVLAGLKPKLLDEVDDNSIILKKPFTFVRQSIGIQKGKKECISFLNKLIANMIEEGFIKNLFYKYNVNNKLKLPDKINL